MNRLKRQWRAIAGAAGLAASVAALCLLFLGAVDRAVAHFDRAAIAQAQLADLLAIRDAARDRDLTRVRTLLTRYHASIVAEGALLPDSERAHQVREEREARMIATLARAGRIQALETLVGHVAARERAEAAETARKVAVLRTRTRLLAVLLTVVALASAVVGAVGLLSANRRLSRAVAARTAEIAAIDASRRLFFAKVSHELRTPVTVMRGEAEVALATAASDPDALAAALREVVAHGELLGRRVEELLALSQAEDGRLALVRRRVQLGEIVRGAAVRVARYAESNNVFVSVSADSSIMVDGDARWLEQAVVAVLDNAVKFSPEQGDVDVCLFRQDPTTAVMTIADRGRGVAPESLPRLFDAYYQTSEGRARGGNGLGLALSRWVMEQHGGSATAAQREGGGCQVTLALPVAA